MPKRFALFVIGFVLAIGAFLLYQYFSGAAIGSKPKTLNVSTGPATTMPMAFESRNEKGELEYLITAESVVPLRDEQERTLPNQLLLKKPVATSYDKSGRTIQLSADECRVIIDQGVRTNTRGSGNLLTGAGGLGPGGAVGAGDRSTGRLLSTVRLGRLSGHVKLSMGERPAQEAEIAASTRIPMRGELKIYFDKDLEFDGNEKILSSAGKVYVRSDSAAFDGEGMQLKFNLDAKRVEYFRMDKGNRAVIRGVGGRALELAGNTETKPAGKAPAKAPARAVASTKPAKEPPVPYKVSFGQDVRVAVLKKEKAEGESVMTAEQLFLYFIAGRDLAGDGNADVDDTLAGTATTQSAQAMAALAPGEEDRPGPMPEAQPNDLVITWQGSVEMRPAGAQDPRLADAKDVAMEAIGTLAKPVRLTDSRGGAVVGRLLFQRSESRIALLPGAYQKVELIDPNKGRVVCQDVVYSQKDNVAKLTGPGMLEAVSAAKGGAPAEVTRVSWNEWMNLEMAKVPDPKDPTKEMMAVRRAVINGVGIHSDAIDMSGDLMDVLIANVADGKGGSTPAMERMALTGNVMVDSLKRAGVASVADKKDGLRAKRMEIVTTKDANGVPVPSQMIAEGETGGVSAWQYQSTDKKLPNESSLLERRMVTTTRLVADLRAKPKAAAGTAAGTSQQAEFAGLGQGFDVTHMVASAGARVDITPSDASAAGNKKPSIVATAAVLDADPVGETAELKGADGVAGSLVRIVLGENSMEGKRVVVDQRKQMIMVPGAGQFLFTLPPDKTRSQPTPMEVKWDTEMQYDNRTKLAVFKGNPVAQMVGDNADLGRIAARDLLTVKMKEKSGTTKPANGGADLLASASLDLDYIQAEGMVDARGAQLGADNKVQTQLRINTDKVLTYRDAEKVFDVPSGGTMVIDNHKPDKPGSKMKSEGTSGFKWEGSLRYDGVANTITFLKDVDFFFKPKTPWLLAAGSSGGQGLLGGVGETAATKPSEPKKVDLVHVRTNRIVATLAKAKEGTPGKTPASPIGLGADGNQELQNVVADGGAELTAGGFGLEGAMLEFDVPTNMAVAAGTADQPAMATRAEEPPIMADRITWNAGTNTLTSSGVRGRVRGN